MKPFDYQARRDGQTFGDRLMAESQQAAREQLEAKGYEILSLAEADVRDSTAAAAAEHRLPVEIVLESLADDVGDRRLNSVVRQLSADVARGVPLEQALDKLGDRAPRYLSGVLRAATSSGELAEVCNNFVRIRRSANDAWVAVWRLLMYPLILLLALTALTFLFALVVIPAFADIFDEFDLELPGATESLIWAGTFLPWLTMSTVLLWLSIVFVPRFIGFGFQLQSALPAMGSLFTSISHEQFSLTLASFLRMRIPLPLALSYAGDIVENRSLGRAAYRTAELIRGGSTLSDAMARSRQFDRALPVLVQWGEDRSALADSLLLAGEMYQDRREQRSRLLSRIAPTFAVVWVASCATAVASALLLPLLKLIEGLS